MPGISKDRVVESVRSFLQEQGFTLLNASGAGGSAFDVDSVRGDQRLVILAVGQVPDSLEGCPDHLDDTKKTVGARILELAALAQAGSSVALALPDSPQYRAAIAENVDKLQEGPIALLWAGSAGGVIPDPEEFCPPPRSTTSPPDRLFSVLRFLGYLVLFVIGVGVAKAAWSYLSSFISP